MSSARQGNMIVNLRRHLDEIPALAARVESFLSGDGVGATAIMHLNLVIEELVTNVIRHGGSGGADDLLEVRIDIRADSAVVTLRDNGIPFNPLAQPQPDLSLPVDQRPVGGLGVYFVRELTDSQHYERQGAFNVLTLTKRID